jgi:hypothetical protein
MENVRANAERVLLVQEMQKELVQANPEEKNQTINLPNTQPITA